MSLVPMANVALMTGCDVSASGPPSSSGSRVGANSQDEDGARRDLTRCRRPHRS
jgi:hypothetical protein